MVNPALQRARFLAPGDKLGKHELIRQIAVGGMAELYLARTMGIEGFEKLVVIKRILPQHSNDASFVNMFLNEARLAATLHHPNIAQVYDIGQDGGEYFFSMEYVHGEDLGRIVRSANEGGVPVSLDAALTFAVGLCGALHHAHEKTSPEGKPLNVVHRDVSPSNVLVSYDGAVKLVDFGIARAATTPGSTAGGLKGKISYMSPEQCRGKTVLDRRSDIFSVGTMLYEMTTGQLPFSDDTEYAILTQIVNQDAAPPSAIVPNYPPALEAILMKALARDPDQRYRTALDLQGDLEDFAHENRLRVSPLVLARLMSNLFPARLEEWANARAQGAFFVEQHVVRTLIENSTVDRPNFRRASTDLPAVAGEMATPPDDDATAVTAPPIAPDDSPTSVHNHLTPPPQRNMPRAATPHPHAATPPPHRPTPTPGRTQVGVAAGPEAHPPMPRAPTPTPMPRAPTPTPSPRTMTPVPGMPGAVPIMSIQPSQPGTLVSNPMAGEAGYPMAGDAGYQMAADSGSSIPTARPVASVGDLTLRVQLPSSSRSRKPAIMLAFIGAIGAALVTYFVLSRGDDSIESVATNTAPAAKPAPTEVKSEPIEAKPAPVELKPEPDVAKPDEPKAEAKPEAKPDPVEVKPEPKPEPKPAKPVVAKKPVARPVAKPVAKPIAKPVKRGDPVAKNAPDPKPEPKPEPKGDQWKGDSPFMPVRVEKR